MFTLTQNSGLCLALQIQAEIAAIRDSIDALQEERATLTINDVVMCEDSSPLAIAEAYRHHARETAQISTEIKGIDDAFRCFLS